VLDVVFAPLSRWSTLENISMSSTTPDLPAMAVDAEGQLHMLWAEPEMSGSTKKVLRYAQREGTEERDWTRPVTIMALLEDSVEQPTLAVLGDFVHALWNDIGSGEIWHSRAFVQDASSAAGWSTPQPLPVPESKGSSGTVSWPHIVAQGGVLHAVYAVPANEGRGIYYLRSEDEGESWLLSGRVFDAEEAGWLAADTPRLAVDAEKTVHVVWSHASLSASQPPRGIYYASSHDDGETWSEPFLVAEGAYAWPRVEVGGPGQVHVLWSEATGGGVWHRWLATGSAELTTGGLGTQAQAGARKETSEEEWSLVERVPGFHNVSGPVGLAGDGVGTLHLVGLGNNEAGDRALLYDVWRGSAEHVLESDQWDRGPSLQLEIEPTEPGVSIALQPALNALDVAFRGLARGQDDSQQVKLWCTGRTMSPALPTTPGVVPALSPTKLAQPTPSSSPAPSSLSTPVPTKLAPVTTTSPGAGPSLGEEDPLPIPNPLVLGGGLAVLVVAGVFGLRFLLNGRR
jgi:hypothetical protein